MELVLAMPPAAYDTAVSLDNTSALPSAKLSATWREALGDSQQKSAHTPHFADILGQTLAGPLFATWSPSAAVVAIDKPAETHRTVASPDNSGRRDGRRRSRR